MTLPPLTALLQGPLAPYSQKFFFSAAEGSEPAARLLEPGVLPDLLARFATRYPAPADPRAVASLWSKYHFSTWLVPALAANLLLGLDLPVALDEAGLRLAADGETIGLDIPGPGAPVGADRFARIVDRHLAPLIEALAKASGAAPRVFWGNAGALMELTLTRLRDGFAGCGGLEALAALLAARLDAAGRPNPLHAPVRYVPERQRRVCCLRYPVPGLGFCGICPLTEPARARLLAAGSSA
ncbi:siderophore-iron reductase FhuF [Roseomonas sp. 18066]|uniref:siderophore-iron reductase FhuF n=1 Tax=Roseomonas sp. 18066 TaxID=2681412 RepID=UPI00135891A2|nr:siderophore-iron reductase FhuF [Roseomonas sp. 18066]